jgi:hypothetical protein
MWENAMHFNEPVRNTHVSRWNPSNFPRSHCGATPSPTSSSALLSQGSDIWKDAEKLKKFARAEAQRMGTPVPQVRGAEVCGFCGSRSLSC